MLAERPKIYHVASARLPGMVVYHHRNPMTAGVVERPHESRWTSHRIYLRLDPAPAWFDVEWALSLLGFADTEAGRRRFDEFVMETNIDDREWLPPLSATPRVRPAPRCVDWSRLIREASAVTGLDVPMGSKARSAVETRLLVARIATIDLGQTHAAVAERLGMSPGSISNLLSRSSGDPRVARLLAELRGRFETE